MKIMFVVKHHTEEKFIDLIYTYNPDECNVTTMDDLKGDTYLVVYSGDNCPTTKDLNNFLS